ncbi:MAG: viperin family antiviral radical SAM protein [Spirochaetaceae bacterium]|jgi:radical S-adenosyl methionine domain-containing protein 2|nr:viperin family antiviral radical SAM protein [Spirochaetaceae bacterium]
MSNVFNLHFTDACNYHCSHCFVKRNNHGLSIEDIIGIINNTERYFLKNKIENGRINLAGGEPLIVKNIQDIIDIIFLKGIEVSLITNGSLLTEIFIKNNVGKISMIGISVDSLNNDTNKKIGRCDKSNKALSYKNLLKICKYIKYMKIKLKINICISRINLNENFFEFLTEVRPDRLKLLQMTIDEGVNDYSISNTISEKEFHDFCTDYNEFKPIIEPSNKIKDAYFIIDSEGNIGTSNAHNKAQYNLLNIELDSIISKIKINKNSYNDRYV